MRKRASRELNISIIRDSMAELGTYPELKLMRWNDTIYRQHAFNLYIDRSAHIDDRKLSAAGD